MYDICKRLLSGDVVGSRVGMGVVVGPSPSMESVSASEPERRHRRAMFVIYGMAQVYCIWFVTSPFIMVTIMFIV